MIRTTSRFPQSFHKVISTCALLIAAAAPSTNHLFAADKAVNLKQQFLNPSPDARPMMRWWWFGTAVEKPEILRELQQMKADGIGGVELAFVYPQVLDDPSKGLVNEPFVGPEMLANVRYAQAEGRKLGLRVDVTLGSGWPYGSAATTLDEAATRLRVAEISIPSGATNLPRLKLAEGESILSAALVAGQPKQWDATTAQSLTPADSPTFTAATTPRTALFFIQSHTKQQVKRAAVGSEGWVLDPFSRKAVATHLKAVGEPLLKAFGATPPYAVFSDSLEAYGADWTPTLPAEFKRRRGYDLLPHLPELVAGGTPAAEQVRHDWGQTLTELVNQNYLTQINQWAIAHHTKFRSQTYGEPAVTFSSQKLVALPEGEGPQWRQFSTLRWASSANHVFGNNVTSGETFTWLHSPVFRATPLDMKAEADIDFIMGENQLIFHGWPYSPPPNSDGTPKVPEPGWSLYAAGAFNDHNPWHPVMPDVTRYIQRMSSLLRQGQPANQVAILLPTDDAWASFTPGKVTVTGALAKLITPTLMSTILSAGYNIDYIDAEAINTVGLGTHQILVIPPTDRIPIKTLRKISAWVAAGGHAVAVGRAPSLDAEGKSSPELTHLSKQLFDRAKFTLMPDSNEMAAGLFKAATPDFLIEEHAGVGPPPADRRLGFIRRRLPNADIYFVANTSNIPVDTFLYSFGTAFSHAEAINPDTGAISLAARTCMPLRLAPYESRVFIFTAPAKGEDQKEPAISNRRIPGSCTADPVPPPMEASQLADLSNDWKVTFSATGLPKATTQATLTDWLADPATKNYSGEVVYTRDFTLDPSRTSYLVPGTSYLQVEGGQLLPGSPNSPPEHAALGPDGLPNPLVTRTGPGMHAYYDPPIREAAIVFINGQRAGSLWHPPYRLDVSSQLKPGLNHIEIRVYNTALNAWAALPPHDYKPLIEKYGDRFQMQDLHQVKPLPSGILGKIHLVTTEPTR